MEIQKSNSHNNKRSHLVKDERLSSLIKSEFISALEEYDKLKKHRFKQKIKSWCVKFLNFIIAVASLGGAVYQFWGQNNVISAGISIAIGTVLIFILSILKKGMN